MSPKMPFETWESQQIMFVLGVTLDQTTALESAVNESPTKRRVIWLKEMQEELGTEKIRRDHADSLLIARLSLDPNTSPQLTDEASRVGETSFEYLTGCWKRVYESNRSTTRIAYSSSELQEWKSTFDKLKELIISYCGYTLEDPSMFPQPSGTVPGPAEFLPLLLAVNSGPIDPYSNSSSSSVPSIATRPHALALSPTDLPYFLNDLSSRFQEEGLDHILENVLSHVFQAYYKITPPPDILNNEWKAWAGAINTLTSVKGIAAQFPRLSVWFDKAALPHQIEWLSLLGPLTRLSVFPKDFPSITQKYFLKTDTQSKDDIKANKETLGQMVVNLQDEIFKTYNAIVRASPESREGLLEFFADVVRRNQKRSGMQVDYSKVSSDSFMMNMQGMLLRLFDPVLDVTYSKIDKIDCDYYRHSQRIDIKEETKMRANQEESNEYYGGENQMSTEPAAGTSAFISDIFFLLQSYQHLGINKTLDNRNNVDKDARNWARELKKLESQQSRFPSGSPEALRGEAKIKQVKNHIEGFKSAICAFDAALLNKEIIAKNVNFLAFSMTWLVRLVDPRNAHPTQMIDLPLPQEAPMRFRMLPEYLLENTSDYLEFVVRNAGPDTLSKSDKDTILTFVLVFLSPNYVNNPFLKAKFMSMLAMGVQPWGYFRHGIFYDNLVEHPLAVKHLMPTLVRFFVDVEMTGGHTQFWDKFNFRRDIDAIIHAVWSNPAHRDSFIRLRHEDFELIIRFCNMLMSDTTFHLDESLTGLAKIHTLRSEMQDESTWNAKSEAEQEEARSALSQAESNTPFHTMMGRSHIQLMKEFTATTREPFLTGEIVGRLAAVSS